MPVISRFFGIVVFMNFREHEPAHFHVAYQDQEVSIEIETGIVEGKMSKRALRMVFEWAELHHDELLENWERVRTRQTLHPINPLS